MSRIPLEPAEENNTHGVGSLTDAEVSEFSAAVDHLRSVIPTAFGLEWNDAVFSGDGYVVTEMQRGNSGYFSGYRGVRKISNGFAVMSGDERRYEGAAVTFSRFEDAVKGYAAEVIGSFRMHLSGRYLGYVAWMWNGTTGPGVVAQPLNRSNTEFHYFLEDDPSIWLEGRTTAATLSHGLGMSIPAFIAAVVAHPKVTGKDATAWPKPVQP